MGTKKNGKIEVFLLLALVLAGAAASRLGAAPGSPQTPAIVRIYYDEIGDLIELSAVDLFEYNNLREKYVLAAVTSQEQRRLQNRGWLVVPDRLVQQQVMAKYAFYGGYRTVSELHAHLEQRAAEHPGLTELFTYGESYCKVQGGCDTPGGEHTVGHDLVAIRVSNEAVPGSSQISGSTLQRGQKPVFFLLANIHAREISTPEIALRWLDWLLEAYGEDAEITWLVDNNEMWIVPTANPDGHWVTELGEDPAYGGVPLLHRKNVDRDSDKNGIDDCTAWPTTAGWQFGVDLNRNHSFGWSASSISSACEQTFSGPAAASEAETASLQALISSLFADMRQAPLDQAAPVGTTGMLITLHSFGNLVLRPFGFSASFAANEPELKAMGDRMASLNGYLSCRPPDCLYFAHGTTDDWGYGELGIPSFTFEIGSLEHGFTPPYSAVDSTQWPQNRDALLYAALLSRLPYQLAEGPDVVDPLISDVRNRSVTLGATGDSSDTGKETLVAIEYALDVPFWENGAESEPMVPVDGPFDSTSEDAAAQLDLTQLSPGRHMVFLRGRDDQGRSGVTRTLFLDVPTTLEPADVYLPFLGSGS